MDSSLFTVRISILRARSSCGLLTITDSSTISLPGTSSSSLSHRDLTLAAF